MITQGKWEVGSHAIKDDRDPIFYHADVICNSVVRVARSSGIGEEEATDNARLIAAAPDLLEACKLVKDNMDGQFKSSYIRRTTLDKIKVAIAKAEI